MTPLIEIVAVEPYSRASGEDPVRVDSESLVQSRFESYLSDESGLGPGNAQAVFFPVTEKQLADFLREMNTRKIPVTISGGRTGIVGGAVPIGGALISLDRMNRIVGIGWDDPNHEWRVMVEPGIRLCEFHHRIATKDLEATPWSSNDLNWKDLPHFLNDPQQYLYPPDPTEESASLGGTIATDASGARTYFYGRTRNYVRTLRVVLASGDVLALRRGDDRIDSSGIVAVKCLDGSTMTMHIQSIDRPNVKCAAGYFCQKNMDLVDLFIGSEGTLGVVTLVEVALAVAPSGTALLLAFFPSEDDATHFVLHIRSRKLVQGPLVVHSMEYFDSNSLNLLRRVKQAGAIDVGIKFPNKDSSVAILSEIAYQDLAEAVQLLQEPLKQFGSSLYDAVSAVEQRDKDRLKALRHAVPEAINKIVSMRKAEIPGMHKIGTDTAVPDDKLEPMMKYYSSRLKASGLEHYVFGHIAENHLHVNILPRNPAELSEAERLAEDLAKEAVALGGTVSAEHGIGKMKRDLLRIMFSEGIINQMLTIKKALDPNLLLSPGNIFSETD